MDLNADSGVEGYADRYRHSYADIGADLLTAQPWTDDALRAVVAARRADVPLEDLKRQREWRDRRLMQMLAAPLRDRAAAEGENLRSEHVPT